FVIIGGYPLWALVLLAAFLAGYEYVLLARRNALWPSFIFCFLLIALLVCDGQFPQWNLGSWGVPFVTLIALATEIRKNNAPGSLSSWALTIAGGIYIGYPIGTILRLRAMDQGLVWLILVLLGTWICDTGAYFVGVRWGKHKFFPMISPKKTWEGALGGLVAGMLAVIPFAMIVLHLSWWWSLIISVLIVLGATFGDLAESVIKRQLGAKDSSNLIPGHGGMLDRIDSLLFVFPLVYYAACLIAQLVK
ncbi:MAG: phosphatidate cytidylyltransferase, partial [Anaerolineae bacterium]